MGGGGGEVGQRPTSLCTKMYHSGVFPFLCTVFVVKTDGKMSAVNSWMVPVDCWLVEVNSKGSGGNSEPAYLLASLMSCLRSGKRWLMRQEAAFCATFQASFLASRVLPSWSGGGRKIE